jgi:hypothetical protein
VKKHIIIAWRAARAPILALLSMLIAPMTWLLLLAFGGAAAISTAIHLLFGLPFAMICGGLFSLLFAFIIFRGMGKEG